MAIYKDANGQWRDSDNTPYGDPGIPISGPGDARSSGGGGGGGGGSSSGAPTPPSPSSSGAPVPPSTDGATWGNQSQEVHGLFTGTYGDNAQQIWEQQHAAASGAPLPATNEYGIPIAGRTTPAQATVTPANQVNVWKNGELVSGPSLESQSADQVDQQQSSAYTDYLKQIADANKSAQDWQQNYQQSQLDLQKAIADGDQAYKNAMLQYNDRQLAQQAYDAAVQNSLRQQQVQIQASQVALERQKANDDRAKRRPLLRARVRII